MYTPSKDLQATSDAFTHHLDDLLHAMRAVEFAVPEFDCLITQLREEAATLYRIHSDLCHLLHAHDIHITPRPLENDTPLHSPILGTPDNTTLQ